MKSKVLALVLACLMILSVPVFAATYSDVPETHDRYEAINMLSSMDIITGFPDGSFKPDEAVTRAQMAALITRMFNLGSSSVTAEPFSDVTVSYWAASDIVSAKNRGIINGFPDGTFQPEAEVTYEQAVKMIVCALNYGAAAEKSGGYPNGYIQQASKLGILKTAAYTQDKAAPRGIIAQLLYNSLNVDMLVPQINADGTVDYVKSESGNNTVSQQFLKTETLKGVTVVRTPRVKLENAPAIESVNDNAMFVKKADNTYVKVTVQDTSAFNYIGQLVDITYKVDAEDPGLKTLSNITLSPSVRAYENIKLTNVISLDTSGLRYYTDKANNRENNLNFSGTPVVIYNERLHSNGIAAVNADLFSVSNHEYANGVISVYVSGNQTLIKVKSYKNYVVESVDARTETINVKGSSGNIPLNIPYKDTYINETVIKKGTFDFGSGAAVANATKLSGYTGIAKGNIIAFASNTEDTSNKYFEVLVSGTALNGTVNGIETDDETGRSMIQVGNSNITRLSRDLARYNQTATAQIEVNAKFHIDPFGEIGYISNVKTQDIKLGIPVSVTTGGTGFDKITQLEIYNVDSDSVETLRFRDEVANDPRVAVLKDGSGNLITDSLFKYTIKNGQIETMEPVVAGTTNTDDPDYDPYTYNAANSMENVFAYILKDSSKIMFDDEEQYDANNKFIADQSITYNSSSTKIILIGSVYDTGKVTPKTTTLANNSVYTGKVYQMNNKKSGTSYNMQYVIVRPFEGLTKDSATYIVDSIGGTILQGDTNVVPIKAYPFTGTSKSGNGGALEEIVLTAPVATALNLQKGDVFTYYDVPSTVADIETLRNVYILARAKDIANGTYPTAGALVANNHMDTANSGTGYNADYNYFAIKNNSSNIAAATNTSVYAYYLGTPLAYLTDEAGVQRDLRMAKDATTKLPVMANDTAEITSLATDLNNSDRFFDYNLTQLANIYVYDDAATLDADKLIQVKGKDQVRSYLEGLQTIEKNQSRLDTLMVRAFNSSNNNFYNLYIIKDARDN